MQDVPSPVALMIASFLVRSVLVVIGFFIIYGGRLERLVGAMIGFLLARIILIRRLQFKTEQRERPKEET
jgi:F1F0 ATPase subunit 2